MVDNLNWFLTIVDMILVEAARKSVKKKNLVIFIG